MRRKRLPNSIRKFIRFEKAKIRRQVFNADEIKGLIGELYKNLTLKPKIKKLPKTEISQKKVKVNVTK